MLAPPSTGDKGQFSGYRHTPRPPVPAKTFVPLIPSDRIDLFPRPLLMSVQLAPWSVERNTPSLVPANRLVPLTANALTPTTVDPAAVQVSALSVARNTPPSVRRLSRVLDRGNARAGRFAVDWDLNSD